MSGILPIEAALGLHGTDLPARKRHGFEDAFKFEIGFAVGPLGGPGGRLRILSAIALLTHAMNNPGLLVPPALRGGKGHPAVANLGAEKPAPRHT